MMNFEGCVNLAPKQFYILFTLVIATNARICILNRYYKEAITFFLYLLILLIHK